MIGKVGRNGTAIGGNIISTTLRHDDEKTTTK